VGVFRQEEFAFLNSFCSCCDSFRYAWATPALGRIVVRPRSFVAVTDLSKIFDRANLVRAYRWIMPADPKEKCKDKVAEVGLR